MKRWIGKCVWFALAATVFFIPAKAPAEDRIWAPAELSRLIEEALSRHPAITGKQAAVDAARARIGPAGALPDPMIGVGALNMPTDTFRFDQEPMTQKQIAVEQRIPWPSKRGIRSDVAEKAVKRLSAELEETRLNLAQNIADTYYELGFTARSLEINDRLAEMLTRLRRDAQSRYTVGEGLQQDIFQAEVELSRLRDEAIMLKSRVQVLQDRLHEFLGREEYSSVPPPLDLAEPQYSLSEQQLVQAALSRNPKLQGLEAAVSQSAAGLDLAEKSYYPDFNVRLAYGQRYEDRTGRDLPDFFSASMMINVPLWYRSKQSKEVAAARQELRAAQHRYNDLKERLVYRVSALVAEIRDTKERYSLYTVELIPQARQWARSAFDAYEVGGVAFDAMIEARLRVLRYERQAARLLYTVYQKRAQLGALAGGPLPEADHDAGTN
jgi:outer membrane protein TolC